MLRGYLGKRRSRLTSGRRYVGTAFGKDTKILLDARRTAVIAGGKTSGVS